MIPTELILCRVEMTGHSMEGYYYVASSDDGEPQTEPEKTAVKAIESFTAYVKAATGKQLDKLTLKVLLHLGRVSIQDAP